MKFQDLFSHIGAIEEKLGYHFRNPERLLQAFVHRSYINENKQLTLSDNERLEFLGDAVLNLVIAEYLYQNLPEESEGKLSNLRAQVISSSSCIRYFEQLKLHEYMLVGRGEELQAGKSGRSSIVADMFEAIFGAIYQDGGLEEARRFFLTHFQDLLAEVCLNPEKNWKALLQEHTQKMWQKIPLYQILSESGPEHARFFEVGVFLDSNCLGRGSGSTKKEAEREAAYEALQKLENT